MECQKVFIAELGGLCRHRHLRLYLASVYILIYLLQSPRSSINIGGCERKWILAGNSSTGTKLTAVCIMHV